MSVEMNRESPPPPVFDGHEDFITQMEPRGGGRPRPAREFLEESQYGHVDLPRAMRGGLGGCFTSIYLTDERAEANALHYAMREISDVLRIAERSDGGFRVCRSAEEVRAAFSDGAFASVFMLEGADPISRDLKELRVFYEVGLRCLAPTWSRSTVFARGVAFQGALPESGLTEAGRERVAECNRLGINFAVMFLRGDMQNDPDTPMETIVEHFDHIVNLVGDEHVSFGTDFDGAGMPAVVGDATRLPVVLRALQDRGYSDDRLERICNGNFLRVASEVWC